MYTRVAAKKGMLDAFDDIMTIIIVVFVVAENCPPKKVAGRPGGLCSGYPRMLLFNTGGSGVRTSRGSDFSSLSAKVKVNGIHC